MTKSKEEKAPEAPKGFFKKLFYWLLFWAVIGSGGYYVWKNPAVLTEIRKLAEVKPQDPARIAEGDDKAYMDLSYRIASIEDGLLVLTQKVGETNPQGGNEDYSSEIIALKDKYDMLDRQVQTKADTGPVIAFSSRIDVLEEKVKDVARISDKGALILTAAMLVKERADTGSAFLFEADVLQELAKDDEAVKNQVAAIVKAAGKGVISETEIKNSFWEVAEEIAKDNEKNLTWKGKVKAKLDEVVQIKKVNEKKEAVKNPLELTKQYLQEGVLAKAVAEAGKIGTANEKLAEWTVKVNEKLEFNAAVSEIAAHSLALMKVNQIKAAE